MAQNDSLTPGAAVDATSTVTITASGFDSLFVWCIINPDGSEGTPVDTTNGDSTSSVTGAAGGSCYLRAKGSQHSTDSGDNFVIGDQGVIYTCTYDDDPFSKTFCHWSRTN